MKKLLLLFLVGTCSLQAQTLWNDTIPLSVVKPQITDMIVNNDTIIVYGDCFNNTTDYKQGLIFAKLDSNGNVLAERLILDSLGDRLAIDDSWGKVIKTKDGGYAATAATVSRKSAFLIKLNYNLDIEFIKEYPDTIAPSNFDFRPLEVPGGYLLFGGMQLPDLNNVGVIKYVDEQGGLVWEHRYNFSTHGTWIVDLAMIHDSTFIFLTAEAITSFSFEIPQSWRAGIYRLNLLGEISNPWKSEPEPEIGYLRKVIPVSDTAFITYGMQLQQVIDGPVLIGQPTLTSFNFSYQKKWIRHFGEITPLDWELTLRDFSKTADGNFVGVGRTRVPVVGGNGKAHGWLYKFSADGDEVWSRNFPSPFPDNYSYNGWLYGVGLLSSGNIVAGGYATTGQSLHCWLVKLTNDGCMDTLFCQTNAVEDVAPIKPQEKALQVFPNPANEQLHITYTGTDTVDHFQISNIYGQIVRNEIFGVHEFINTAGLPTGMYFLDVYSGHSFVERARVVISH